jgi:peptidoglycan/LPS O-acetylase OafA/YrhL
VLYFVKPTANMAQPFMAELPYYLTYTANWIDVTTFLGITWSLAAEEQFYVVWPPIEKLLGKLVMPTLFAFVFVNQLVNFRVLDDFLLDRMGLDFRHLEMLQVTFTPILLGVLLAHVLHDRRGFASAWRWLAHPASPLVLLGLLFTLCNLPMSDISGLPRLSIQIVMMLLVGACVIRDKHVLRGLLTISVIKRLGVVSYGMYLFHMFARHGADVLLGKSPFRFEGDLFLVCLLLTWAISEVSFRFYETPFLRLKKRFETRR